MIRAHILDGVDEFLRNEVRLVVVRSSSYGQSVLMADGLWVPFEEGTVPPEGAGVPIPRDAIEAVHDAIEQWKGYASHGATEVKVLREALEVERGRVSSLLDKLELVT